MTGLILCGGQSERMGEDKGLLYYQSKTWAQNACDLLSAFNMPICLSLRQEQVELYKDLFVLDTLVLDANINIGGPVKGILSAHLQYPSEDFFVLACDLLLMQTEMIQYLIDESKNKEAEAFVFIKGNSIEPLCGIYTSVALDTIYFLYKEKKLERHSMKYLLSKVKTIYLDIPCKWKDCLNNYNSENDLKAFDVESSSFISSKSSLGPAHKGQQ